MIYKTVNLEEGMPLVREASARMAREIATARSQGVRVLKLIHGYGSSGTGGRLRTELRKELLAMKQAGKVKDVISGEEFTIFNAGTQKILPLSKEIGADRDLDRYNNGVTLVVL